MEWVTRACAQWKFCTICNTKS